MKKVLIAGGVAVAIIVGGVGIIAAQPDQVSVERQLTIAAAPSVVFPYINDLSRFSEWSPWQDLDPDQVIETSSPSAGVGAR